MTSSNSDSPARLSQPALDSARLAFEFGRGEFHHTEEQFLKVLDELWATNTSRILNLAKLEGLRMQLMESIDSLYRTSVNTLVDALLDSIGEPAHDGYDGRNL